MTWNILAILGEKGFESTAAAGAFVALKVLTNELPSEAHALTGLDATPGKIAVEKDNLLREATLRRLLQEEQMSNPDARVSLKALEGRTLLNEYAWAYKGLETGDLARFGRRFWELPSLAQGWDLQQSTVDETVPYGGRSNIVLWEDGKGAMAHFRAQLGEARNNLRGWKHGIAAWNRFGIGVSLMRDLPVCLYTGEIFDNNSAAIIPHDCTDLPALWAFCSSPEFNAAVRRIDSALKVTNATLVKVPFDLEHWQKVAEEMGPLPDPHSDDLTQWLFGGHPAGSEAPLQVAVARLLGYHWPQQGEDALSRFADTDGIVCLPPVGGEQPVANRVWGLLATAYGEAWSTSLLDKLLADTGSAGKDLAVWLRDDFFAQHCRLFHNRPFIWHVWDGRKDGFSALVNYHQLDAGRLEKLIYTYLGSWIATQKGEMAAGTAGAEGRYLAAQELQRKLIAIREGEPPYDIYVRWKPLHEQPIGWEPDLNDGVRLNVRPWMAAGVLRGKFTVNWNKDRGINPDGSERLNDLHLTSTEKRRARETAVESLTSAGA